MTPTRAAILCSAEKKPRRLFSRRPLCRYRLPGALRRHSHEGVRLPWLLAERFRYAVYYKVDGEKCIVFRVLDCRQEPEKTTEGLR
jgi:hypothetical protein